MKRRDDDHVNRVIEVARLFLEQELGQEVQRVGSPDREDRNTRACDAILQSTLTSIALEHTSLDSYRDQRLDDARFLEVLGKLEDQLKGQLPDHVDVSIPTHAIVPGQDWTRIASTIHSWFLTHLANLPYDRWQEVRIPSVPFALMIRRERSVGEGSMFGMRWVPPNHREQRVQVIVDRLMDKSEVLQKYKDQGYRSVLVIESGDVALTNRHILCEEFRAATQIYYPQTIDEVLLVETDTRPWCVTQLKTGYQVMATPEPHWPTAPGYPIEDTA